MAKTIVIKLKKAGNRSSKFSISDNYGNILVEETTKDILVSGISLSVNDEVTVIIITSINKNCCNKSWNIPISTITLPELAAIEFKPINTGSVWEHLTDITIYNKFYGCINPYIIEYPFAYSINDQIVQSVKDYTKVFSYYISTKGIFDYNRKIQTNNKYFNKVLLYNDQQSSGILELVTKPINNLKSYLTYPKYNTESKTIIYTKSDNFYQFNTFWDIVVDKTEPLFITSCENLSIDKEVNNDNMIYINKSYKKYPLRAKDNKIRFYLDDLSDSQLVTQFVLESSQISYK